MMLGVEIPSIGSGLWVEEGNDKTDQSAEDRFQAFFPCAPEIYPDDLGTRHELLFDLLRWTEK